nr:hypothetical protein [Pseudomonas sp. BIGb0427]
MCNESRSDVLSGAGNDPADRRGAVSDVSWTAKCREVRALSAAYFKTYDTGEKLPRAVRQTERCFHNLLESTPPFYFLCVALISLAKG